MHAMKSSVLLHAQHNLAITNALGTLARMSESIGKRRARQLTEALEGVGYNLRDRGEQKRAAKALGVSAGTLSRNLRGENDKEGPKPKFMRAVGKLVGREWSEIFSEEDSTPPKPNGPTLVDQLLKIQTGFTKEELKILRTMEAFFHEGPSAWIEVVRLIDDILRHRKKRVVRSSVPASHAQK